MSASDENNNFENNRNTASEGTSSSSDAETNLPDTHEGAHDDPFQVERDPRNQATLAELIAAAQATNQAQRAHDATPLRSQIEGSIGSEKLFGTSSDDAVFGGAGNDSICGGSGNDLLVGGTGRDALVGRDGHDTLDGGDGNDVLGGGAGDDVLSGGKGNDRLYGSHGNDALDGGAGNDLLRGDAGDDLIIDDLGDDRLMGGSGNDTLQIAEGSNRAFGGSGDDVFVYDATLAEGGMIEGGAGFDTLTVKVASEDYDAVKADFSQYVPGRLFYSEALGASVRNIEVVDIEAVDVGPLALVSVMPADMAVLNADPTLVVADEDRFYPDSQRIENQPGITMAPSGQQYQLVIDEQFDYASTEEFTAALNDGTSGVWSTHGKLGSRLGDLRGAHSVYTDPRMKDQDGNPLDLNPFTIEDGVVSIRAGLIPDAKVDDVKAILDADPGAAEMFVHMPDQHKNDPNHEGGIDYFYTGALTTTQSWASTYGYYEIKTTLPEGEGYFPAFWLTSAGEGWPPEIDIFENVGREDSLILSVLADEYGLGEDVKKKVHDLDTINNRGLDFAHYNEDFQMAHYESGAYADVDSDAYFDLTHRTAPNGQQIGRSAEYQVAGKQRGEEGVTFKHALRPEDVLAAAGVIDNAEDYRNFVHEQSFVMGAEWTPNEVIFYMGLDNQNMVEVFRTETPEDVTSAQYVLANLQFGGRWPGYPTQDEYDMFATESMDIDYIKIYAMSADDVITVADDEVYIYGNDYSHQTNYKDESMVVDGVNHGEFTREVSGDDVIIGNDLDNVIRGGSGLDEFTGGKGADTFIIEGDDDNKFILDFNPEEGDKVVIEGWHIEGKDGAFDTLTQVGDDVWLIKGAEPHDPQTVIFRDITLHEFRHDSIDVFASEGVSGLYREEVFKTVVNGDEVHGTQHSDVLKSDFRADGVRYGGLELYGGKGDDKYIVRGNGTTIHENAGEGIDTIETNRNWVLSENVENLIGIKRSGQSLTGNDGGNRITGGSGDDTFNGRGGDDMLILGRGGADTVEYGRGDGSDAITGFGANDVVELAGFAFASFAALQERLFTEGRDTVLDLGGEDRIVFRDTKIDELTEANFAFETGKFVASESEAEAGGDRLYFENVVEGTVKTDLLSGFASRDTFVFHHHQTFGSGEAPVVDVVRNFALQDGDALDLSGLFAGLGETNALTLAAEERQSFLSLVIDDGHTHVMFDRDGAGDAHEAETVVILENVELTESVAALTSSDVFLLT